MAAAQPPTRRRTSRRSPPGFVFERRTVTTTSPPSAHSISAQRRAAYLATAQRPVEEQRDDRGVDEATTLGRLGAFESASGTAWSEAGGEHGGALLGGEAAGLAAPGDIGARGAPEALEGLPGQRPGRWLLADIAGGTPHGGDYHRGGRCGSAGLVEMPQVRGEARILEPPAVEPAGELAKGRRVDAVRVHRR